MWCGVSVPDPPGPGLHPLHPGASMVKSAGGGSLPLCALPQGAHSSTAVPGASVACTEINQQPTADTVISAHYSHPSYV